MLRRVWLFVALAFVAAATVPPGSPRVPLEADAPPPEARAGWTKAARAPGDAPLTLTFLLRQRNVAELERRLAAVSDPRSPEYGRHLSNAAVHALVAPSAAALSAVRGFLRDHGVRVVDDATPNGDMLTATTTVAKAEELLGAAYHRSAGRGAGAEAPCGKEWWAKQGKEPPTAEQGTWASRTRKRNEADCGRPEDGGGADSTNSQTTPAQPSIRQLLGAA